MNESINFDLFNESKHMLEWFHQEPFDAIIANFKENLDKQVQGSVLQTFQVTENPDWLTASVPNEEYENDTILKRAGVAFPFALSVKVPEGDIYELDGVYTWVAVNLDEAEAEQRIWVDMNGTLEELGSDGELIQRVLHFEKQD